MKNKTHKQHIHKFMNTGIDFTPEPSGPTLDSAEEVDTFNTKLLINFKKTVH